MNRLLILILSLLFLGSQVNGQVVLKEYLSSDHEGMIAKSFNNDMKPLYYDFIFNESGEDVKIEQFTLNMYSDAGKNNLILSCPVTMRDLLVTFYIDVIFEKDDYPKGAAAIFKKDFRYVRIKFVPHQGCKNPENNWEPKPEVESFEDLLNHIVTQLDKNVFFSCYKQ